MSLQIEFLNGLFKGRILNAPTGLLTIGANDADIEIKLEGKTQTIELIFGNDDDVRLTEPTTCRINGRKKILTELPINEVIEISGLTFLLAEEGSPPTEKKIVVKNKIGMAIVIIASTLAFFMVLAQIYYFKNERNEAQQTLQEWLVTQHSVPALRELGIDVKTDMTVNIYGHCSNQDTLNEFLEGLKERSIRYYLETQCQDSVLEQVRYILDENGFSTVNITNGQYLGDIVLKGDIQSDEKWQRIVKELTSVQGLDKWSVSRGTRKNQGDTLLTASRRANLIGSVSIIKRNKQIIVSGEIDELQREAFEEEVKEYLDNNDLTVIYQDIPNNNLKLGDFFTKQLVSIGGNIKKPYILLSDGTKLEKGAKIKNGYEIVNISSEDGLDVYKDGSLIHLTITI
ncbi:EscD/YscD/HrpQ family type III secretion system inner membrane ring protein [Enterobacter hormaechei]|nr:EscD/YscD/HrpQ family type III secretion system inner membrane ring protein [Enterobacter hormaechei]